MSARRTLPGAAVHDAGGARRRRRTPFATPTVLALALAAAACGEVSDAAVAPPPPPRLMRSVLVRIEGSPATAVRASYTLRGGSSSQDTQPPHDIEFAADGTATFEVPDGERPLLRAAGDGAFVWPAATWPVAGSEVVLHAEPLRDLPLRLPPELPRDAPVVVIALPDRLDAGPAEPGRADALEQAAAVVHETVTFASDAAHVSGLVAAPCHVFVGCLGEFAYVHVGTADVAIDAAAAWGRAAYAGRLTIDGAEAPSGTIAAPGRLDLVALGAATIQSRKRGTTLVSDLRTGRGALELPRSEWITLWHPTVGLAHVRPTADAPIDARTGPCRIVLRAPDRVALSGSVTVWPAWPAGNDRFLRPEAAVLRREVSGATEILVSGLPPGRYRLEYDLVAAREQPVAERYRADVRLTLEQPAMGVEVRQRR